jgi:hypothetical protein
MISAVDSSIVLDVLSGGTTDAERSLDAIRKASLEGKLIVSESVVAEIRPVFSDRDQFDEFMQEWAPSSRERYWRGFCRGNGNERGGSSLIS